jgi:hypothetical protein
MDTGWRSRIEPWTDDRPDPAHWLTTVGLESARLELEEALRAGPDPIVVSGPTGHGKTLLLRSLRTRPPRGFVPMFVPFSNVEPDELAGWILETANRHLGRDPAADLARLLRANMQFDGRTLLLMDEVQATPRATLSKLFEIITEARLRVSVVLAGLPGEALDLAISALPHPIRTIAVSRPWNRADAELLLMQVALTLDVEATDLIEAVDVDAALDAGAGNPRLVRTALAARLRIAELLLTRIPPIRAFAPTQSPTPLAAWAPLARAQQEIAIPITSSEAAARLRRPPAADRSERPPAMTGIRRSTARRALRARTWLGRAARGAQIASKRAAHSILSRGYRMADAAQDHTSALSANLRSRSLARGAALWNGAPEWPHEIQRMAASARLALDRRFEHWRRTRAARIIRLRQSTAPLALRARAWLEGSARSALVASKRAQRSIRTHGHRVAAGRHRARALSARLRSRALAHNAAAWNGLRGRARQIQATAAYERFALHQRVRTGLSGAGRLLRRSERLPLLAARSLGLAVVLAVLATILADGRTTIPPITELSESRGEAIVATIGDPILFRLNSHPWSTIEIDGIEAGTTPFTISLEPGLHHFRVAMADGRILEKELVVSALQDRLAFR